MLHWTHYAALDLYHHYIFHGKTNMFFKYSLNVFNMRCSKRLTVLFNRIDNMEVTL